jgi:hypothetical protein
MAGLAHNTATLPAISLNLQEELLAGLINCFRMLYWLAKEAVCVCECACALLDLSTDG